MNTTYNRIYNEMFEKYAEVNEEVTPMQEQVCKEKAAQIQFLENPTDENHLEWLETEWDLNEMRQQVKTEMIMALRRSVGVKNG